MGCAEPFQSPVGTKSKDTHTEAKVGASREPSPSGCGQRGQGSCPGAARQPASSFHPALARPSASRFKTGVVVISCTVGGRRGLCVGRSLQLLPDPMPPLWGGMASSSALWPSPSPRPRHWCAWKTQTHTVQSSRIPATPPTPLGGLAWWSSSLTDIPSPVLPPTSSPGQRRVRMRQ